MTHAGLSLARRGIYRKKRWRRKFLASWVMFRSRTLFTYRCWMDKKLSDFDLVALFHAPVHVVTRFEDKNNGASQLEHAELVSVLEFLVECPRSNVPSAVNGNGPSVVAPEFVFEAQFDVAHAVSGHRGEPQISLSPGARQDYPFVDRKNVVEKTQS